MDAAAVYELSVERHLRPWSRPLRVLGSLLGAATELWAGPPTDGDCVIRRIDDGREILRQAGDEWTHDHLREQLDTLTAAEFEEAWEITAGTVEG